ncbi:MAG TPA: hypothetical protein VF945_06495, partial [Polyangia bacterium]
YLQRAAQLHVDGGGGGATFSRVATSQLPGNDRTIGWAGVDASGYADRFYGYLGLGVRYLSQSSGTFTSLTLPIDLAAGVRFGDARVLLGWSVAPTRYGNDVFRVPFWGGVYARAYGVVGRRLALGLGVFVREGGAAVEAGGTRYLARRFGLGAFVRGAHGSIAALRYGYDTAGGGLSLEAWTGPRLAVALSCSFDWTKYAYANATSENDYATVIAVSFRLRPR